MPVIRKPKLFRAGASRPELVVFSASWLVSAAISDLPSSEVLPRARIIRRRTTFDLMRQRGRRYNDRWMTLSCLPKDLARPDPATVAFLTPKRLGPATVRNRLRRQMREVYRRRLGALPTEFYLVWIARPNALALDFEGLSQCMEKLFSRVG